jgi:hypothetical protein
LGTETKAYRQTDRARRTLAATEAILRRDSVLIDY